uniref:P53 and DNA damage-regulated protein 1 n=1 Tax=Chenopodium quinoa TaxID=63459 RepID=A0A803L0R2_CHEQI
MQVVENDRLRNGNREALTALRKKACTTKTSVPSPFESIMKEIGGHDVFAQVPFHAAHTILEEDQERLDSELKELQSLVKEKSLIISDKGAIADKISPGILSVHIGLDLYTSGSSKPLMVFGSDI